MHNSTYILLDRSGSMASSWEATLTTLNKYVEGLQKTETPIAVTLAVFDQMSSGGVDFQIIREAQLATAWKPLSGTEAFPRGNTPLYDAIGRLVNLTHADKAEKGVVVIITDGHENASREYTKESSRALLDGVRARGWDVVNLGVEFNNYDQAQAMGTGVRNTVSAPRHTYASGAVGRTVADSAAMYFSGQAQNASFTAAQKAALGDTNDPTLKKSEDKKSA